MGANVVLEVTSCCESLATVLVRTYKWPLACVDPTVDSEVLGGVKPFATPFKIALAWTVTDVGLLNVGLQVCWEGKGTPAVGVITYMRLLFLYLLTIMHRDHQVVVSW